MRFKIQNTSLVIPLAILFAACAPPAAEGAQDQAIAVQNIEIPDTETPAGTNEKPAPFATPRPPAYNPLTGLPVEDPAKLERRPVMIKVSNFPRAGRPHAGLSFADIVFDYYIGYGENRFLALYYGSDSPQVGPVRSGRFIDAQLVTMYGGVLGYGSADEDTDTYLVEMLGRYAVSHLEAPCPAFCGEDTHEATGVFASSSDLSRYVKEMGWDNSPPDLPGMVFSDENPLGAEHAEVINVLFSYYNRAQWRYDKESGKYLRWTDYKENSEPDFEELIPLVDRVTGEQLAFDNVIILFANHTELALRRHEIAIWANDSGMPAVLFRSGMMVMGSWKADRDMDPIQFFDGSGKPFGLKPGKTWITIVDPNSIFEESAQGVWDLFFLLPVVEEENGEEG